MQQNLSISQTQLNPTRDGGGLIDSRIRAFLSGDSHGEDVLGMLYGAVADEPIPDRLRALLNN
jgi:hypothetical protein